MKREYLIQKWLEHDLNAEELEAFKALEDYNALMKLSQGLDHFKAPDFDEKSELNLINNRLKPKTQRWLKPLLRIAAIAIITLGGFWFFNTNSDITIATIDAQKTNFELPDNSIVTLNAASNLTYNKSSWKDKRVVTLDGEAFFKVAKGSTFEVKTSEGTVTVLGTEFNVKQRNQFFEVVCYEGLVSVAHHNQQLQLSPGESFLVIDEKTITNEKVQLKQPSWMINESTFKSIPYKYVLDEFERQYHIKFITKGIDLDKLFTGNFTHDNFQVAIQSVTLPLHLTYSRNNSTVTLMRE
ncbi:FecR family protein [Lacinutrix iliipiscaria]|uniref:FecR family protein n=1 Tax=Lacinutrix iliipiscaria TaxID=1230532 RepID=A0ABW5WKF3_9FLAO